MINSGPKVLAKEKEFELLQQDNYLSRLCQLQNVLHSHWIIKRAKNKNKPLEFVDRQWA